MSAHACPARQYSDQLICDRCGFVWDVNDPDPPRCLTEAQVRRAAVREEISKIRAVLYAETT